MSRSALISLAVSFVTVVAVLAVLEALRRKGYEPVQRIADMVAPFPAPTVSVTTAPSATVAATAVNGAASA